MTALISDRPAYIVFDRVDALVTAAGETLRPAGWKSTALTCDRDTAHAWASDDLHSRVLETTYTAAWQIKNAARLYSDAELAGFFSQQDLIAAE